MAESRIYVLHDPRQPDVARYVGKTRKPLADRLRAHVSNARKVKDNSYRARWLRSLERDGVVPTIDLLEVIDVERENERERHWIAAYRAAGYPLVNTTAGGDGVVDASLEVVAKIRAAAVAQFATEEARAAHGATLKASEAFQAIYRDADYLKRRGQAQRDAWTPERSAARSEVSKRMWSDPEFRERRARAMRESEAFAAYQSSDSRAELGRESMRRLWSDPKFLARMQETAEARAAVTSSVLRARWADDDQYRQRMAQASRDQWADPARRAATIAKAEATWAAKTHCKNGHEYTPENTYSTSATKQGCRTCRRATQQAWKARQRRPGTLLERGRAAGDDA